MLRSGYRKVAALAATQQPAATVVAESAGPVDAEGQEGQEHAHEQQPKPASSVRTALFWEALRGAAAAEGSAAEPVQARACAKIRMRRERMCLCDIRRAW